MFDPIRYRIVGGDEREKTSLAPARSSSRLHSRIVLPGWAAACHQDSLHLWRLGKFANCPYWLDRELGDHTRIRLCRFSTNHHNHLKELQQGFDLECKMLCFCNLCGAQAEVRTSALQRNAYQPKNLTAYFPSATHLQSAMHLGRFVDPLASTTACRARNTQSWIELMDFRFTANPHKPRPNLTEHHSIAISKISMPPFPFAT